MAGRTGTADGRGPAGQDHGRRTDGVRQWLVLGGFIATLVVVAGIGGLGVQGTAQEYNTLRQPE